MRAWILSVDMGYGHQRAAYALQELANERIITVNSDTLLTPKEKRIWRAMQLFYEWISRLTRIPIIGPKLFAIYDKLQSIAEMYPKRDLSKPSLSVYYLRYLLKRGLNKDIFDYLKAQDIPVIATHFAPALAAEHYGMKQVYCVVTDTDINRIWLAKDPSRSKIVYLAPAEHTVKRLKEYGVQDERIIKTGFPLPKTNIGGIRMNLLKKDLGERLPNLDPKKKYLKKYSKFVRQVLGKGYKSRSRRPLTITYMVGGAGAQKEIGIKIIKSLRQKIQDGKVRINVAVGIRVEVADYYRQEIIRMGLKEKLGKGLSIIFAWNLRTYFENINQALRTSDILWTKPSELSFYCGLGIPIIMSPPIGAHEYLNQKWLAGLGCGFEQENPDYTDEWLTDLLESGRLAEAAFDGFIEAPTLGTYNIERVLQNKRIIE